MSAQRLVSHDTQNTPHLIITLGNAAKTRHGFLVKKLIQGLLINFWLSPLFISIQNMIEEIKVHWVIRDTTPCSFNAITVVS